MAVIFALLLALQLPLDQLVRTIEARYNRIETLKANFTQIYREDERAAPREEAGVIYLKKPGRMRWEYTRPEEKLFVSDGKSVYFYAPADRQVTRMPAAESADVRTPLRFLLGKLNLKRAFQRVEIALDLAPLDPGNPVLRLLPKSRDERFREMCLEVDQQYRIRRLVIFETNGTRSEFRFFGEESNPRLDPALFRFVVPPGVEVVDER
jgi:outer membrane lipoprotein carrier protein